MKYEHLVSEVKIFLQKDLADEATGHDWYHIERVYNMAGYLQSKEGGDQELIQLSALLHDISDHKFNGGKLNEGGNVAFDLLISLGCDQIMAEKVKEIIDKVSYKGAKVVDTMNSIEGKIVQDADRLDALGAIGIARAFAFGGNKNRPIYSPDYPPVLHDSFDQYTKAKSHTINHFYEKLLLLKDRLNTRAAQQIGKERHAIMEIFLQQFFKEWEVDPTKKI
jgi:uncharacterized protein